MKFDGPKSCYMCGHGKLWQLSEQHEWRCWRCYPPVNPSQVRTRVVPSGPPRFPIPRLPDYARHGELWRQGRRRKLGGAS